MREPWFWRSQSIAGSVMRGALAPFSLAYEVAQDARRAATASACASIPVICIGNASLGGAGKTPFAILVESLLRERGVKAAFLTRGFGGALQGPLFVGPSRHNADEVGDEALLLARRAMTILAHNRPAGAALAAATGAQAVIMDDGFQNPSLHKDLSILLTDGTDGAVFPAGPMRERFEKARARASFVVSTGQSAAADFVARTVIAGGPPPQRVIAFAGIGRPEKFFATLEAEGFALAARYAFPDHHRYTIAEMAMLAREATATSAALITTEKDHVRLDPAQREGVLSLPVETRVDKPEDLTQRLMSLFEAAPE